MSKIYPFLTISEELKIFSSYSNKWLSVNYNILQKLQSAFMTREQIIKLPIQYFVYFINDLQNFESQTSEKLTKAIDKLLEKYKEMKIIVKQLKQLENKH